MGTEWRPLRYWTLGWVGGECEAFAVVAALSARGQQKPNAGLYTNSDANGIISHNNVRGKRRRGPHILVW